MSFWGYEFLFDGKSCREFGLMVYDIDSNTQGDISFPSAGTIHEERIAGRTTSLFYGLEQNEALTFRLVFGVNLGSIHAHSSLDRWDIASIASWLTGHTEYKWLEIAQPDMETVRYRCLISELETISYNGEPWAFSCTVSCDSPFGYTYPYSYVIASGQTYCLRSKSSYNGYYRPKMRLTTTSGSGNKSFSIVNQSDGGRTFSFTGLPAAIKEIEIDNENQVIVNRQEGLNLYPYCNFTFFRLKRGENLLRVTGNYDVEIICEFPVNIGG